MRTTYRSAASSSALPASSRRSSPSPSSTRKTATASGRVGRSPTCSDYADSAASASPSDAVPAARSTAGYRRTGASVRDFSGRRRRVAGDRLAGTHHPDFGPSLRLPSAVTYRWMTGSNGGTRRRDGHFHCRRHYFRSVVVYC